MAVSRQVSATAADPPDPRAIAVVTVNWNGWAMTLECLEALRQTKGAMWRLILVDNGSTDDSLEHLRDLGEDVVLIESGVNGGWTGGNNLGVRYALDAGYRHVLLLNNDAFVEPDTLRNLLLAKGPAEGGAVLGPVHLDRDGVDYDWIGADIDPRSGFPIVRTVTPEAIAGMADICETGTIKGAGIFADATHFARLGLFDDKFYLNFDETDWCFRARDAGYPLQVTKKARIRHIGSASIGGMLAPLQVYFSVRNALLFAEKHFSLGQRLWVLRQIYWDARNLRSHPAKAGWIWEVLTTPTGAHAAFRRGITDYLFRRFGDCPPIIREWNRQAV